MKFIFTSFVLLVFLCSNTVAQYNIKGKIYSENRNAPIPEATIECNSLKVITSTTTEGDFVISGVKNGSYTLQISADGYQTKEVVAAVNNDNAELGIIMLTAVAISETESLNDVVQSNNADNSQSDEESGINSGQSVGSALNAGRDAFIAASSFAWSTYFYRLRGYEQDNNVTYLNGLPMNELEEGSQTFNTWSGLNDVFRSRSTTMGLQPFDVGFGGLGFNTSLDASASVQRKQTRITYSNANRNYRNRFMITHSSGLNKNGWAYSLSYSKRWAINGVIPGTHYDANSYFAAAEKRIGNHSLNAMIVGSYVNRGRTSPVMQEIYDLTGNSLYNRNWGYQNGVVRNARVTTQHLPMFLVNDEWKIDEKSHLLVAASFQKGSVATTGFDWFNSQNPSPDYYRNLPSYHFFNGDSAIGFSLQDYYKENPNALQVQWDDIYDLNRGQDITTINGETGRRSRTVLGEDVETQTRINASAIYNRLLNDKTTLYIGAFHQNQKVHAFKRLKDLLGGDYWVNVNGFNSINFGPYASQLQNDLQNPDAIVKEGDTYGYNYNMLLGKSQLWSQVVLNENKFDAFFSANVEMNTMQREGIFQSGVYVDNSLGKSQKQTFTTYGVKGGATYKINGRNYLFANGYVGTKAPYYDNIFISSRTRNEVAQNISVENNRSFEGGYLLRTPSIKTRISFFATEVQNAMDIKRYFDDDALTNMNIVMTKINKRYTGVEFGSEIKVNTTLSVNLAASLTQAYYTNRPTLNYYFDNDTTQSDGTLNGASDSAYIKNYYLAAGPQSVGSLGLSYRSPKFWFATLTGNYIANNWIDIAPNYRTSSNLDVIRGTMGEDVYNEMVGQRKLKNNFTLDLFFGKSWRVNKYIKKAPLKSLLFLNIGVNNILNNKNIALMGFEQLRLKGATPLLFQPKYMYAQGTQYFINMAYTF